jgi:hypothetical protein
LLGNAVALLFLEVQAPLAQLVYLRELHRL